MCSHLWLAQLVSGEGEFPAATLKCGFDVAVGQNVGMICKYISWVEI